jgi:hypothetical protein
MAHLDGGRRDRQRGVDLLLGASARLYGSLLALYPKAFRRRYGAEMRRDFRELSREGLEEGGGIGLARIWAAAFSDLALTALKERSTMLARNAYLPVEPEIAARWGALSALLGGSLGITLYLVEAAFSLSSWYEPGFSALLGLTVFTVVRLLCVLGTLGLYGALAAHSGRAGGLAATGAALTAVSAVCVFAGGGYAGARELAIGMASDPVSAVMSEWYSGWHFFLFEVLDLAGRTCWFAGLLLLGVGAFRARLFGSLRALPLAVAALLPASFVLAVLAARIGYFPLLPGGLHYLGTAILGWILLKGGGTYPLTAPSDVAGVSSRVARRAAGGAVSPTAGGSERGVRSRQPRRPPRRRSCWRRSGGAGG